MFESGRLGFCPKESDTPGFSSRQLDEIPDDLSGGVGPSTNVLSHEGVYQGLSESHLSGE